MAAILEGAGLTKVFGRGRTAFTAVDNVSLALTLGRTLGVVGASGSGKSTLGELLGGLQTPSSGSVCFNGTDVRTLDRTQKVAYRRAVQFVFQDPAASMDPAYTVERVVREPLDVFERGLSRAERRARVLAMLERVGLDAGTAAKRPSELSGGQCQRVAIARALVANPQVVICDECTSALDVSVQAQILNLLRDLQRDLGTAYLFISHDMGVVGYMADDLMVMHRGRVVERGPVERVFEHPADAYTKALLAAAAGDVTVEEEA